MREIRFKRANDMSSVTTVIGDRMRRAYVRTHVGSRSDSPVRRSDAHARGSHARALGDAPARAGEGIAVHARAREEWSSVQTGQRFGTVLARRYFSAHDSHEIHEVGFFFGAEVGLARLETVRLPPV